MARETGFVVLADVVGGVLVRICWMESAGGR
jgi:hypothetical protein